MLPFDDQFKEQSQLESLLSVSSYDQPTGWTLSPKLDSGDDVESVSEASALLISIPRSLLSATLPHGITVQRTDQLEGQHAQEGE